MYVTHSCDRRWGATWLVGMTIALLVLCHSSEAQSLPTISGTISELIDELTSSRYFLGSAKEDPRPYMHPSDALGTLHRTAKLLDRGEVEEAARLATQVEYELVEFVETESEERFLLLREDISRLAQPRGWGAYMLNPKSELPAIIEAPHPIDDAHSAEVAALVFLQGAKGLLIAGAQRHKANVPDLVDSVFHQVHVAWTGTLGKVTAWQIHGFAIEKHPFPETAQAVLSTGNGEVTGEIVQLNSELGSRGLEGYTFNRLQPTEALNLEINRGTPGTSFRSLAATRNEQGKHLRALGGSFVHVELERSVRIDHQQRQIAAEAIAQAVANSVRNASTVAEATPDSSKVEVASEQPPQRKRKRRA